MHARLARDHVTQRDADFIHSIKEGGGKGDGGRTATGVTERRFLVKYRSLIVVGSIHGCKIDKSARELAYLHTLFAIADVNKRHVARLFSSPPYGRGE